MNRLTTVMLIALLLGGTLFAVGCHGGVINALDADNNGSEITLEVGETLQIELEGNPTTGFQWADFSDTDPVLGHADEPEYVAGGTSDDEGTEGMVGVGGTYIFTYEAQEAGTAMVYLTYSRPWESVPPIETYSVTVTVK